MPTTLDLLLTAPDYLVVHARNAHRAVCDGDWISAAAWLRTAAIHDNPTSGAQQATDLADACDALHVRARCPDPGAAASLRFMLPAAFADHKQADSLRWARLDAALALLQQALIKNRTATAAQA